VPKLATHTLGALEARPPNNCLRAVLVQPNAARAQDMKGNRRSAAHRREVQRLRPPTASLQKSTYLPWLYRPAQSTNGRAAGKAKGLPALRRCGALTAQELIKTCHGLCIISSTPGPTENNAPASPWCGSMQRPGTWKARGVDSIGTIEPLRSIQACKTTLCITSRRKLGHARRVRHQCLSGTNQARCAGLRA
jgi:hypothetical protein